MPYFMFVGIYLKGLNLMQVTRFDDVITDRDAIREPLFGSKASK